MASLKKLASIPSLGQLYRAGKILASTKSDLPAGNQALNDKICTVQYDLTKLEVDAIVNAANSRLLGGGGVDGAIHRAAGPKLLAECRTLGGCKTGSAKITDAYNLPCKKVIHAVGPVYDTREESEPLLRGCYRTALQLAVENDCKSIAFSAISTGIYGYPSDEAAEAALSEVRTFLEDSNGDKIDKVIFCNFLQKDVDAYAEAMPQIFPPVEESAPEKVSSSKSMGEEVHEGAQGEATEQAAENETIPNISVENAESKVVKDYGQKDERSGTQINQIAGKHEFIEQQTSNERVYPFTSSVPPSKVSTTAELSSCYTEPGQNSVILSELGHEGILRSYNTSSTSTLATFTEGSRGDIRDGGKAMPTVDIPRQTYQNLNELSLPEMGLNVAAPSPLEETNPDLTVTKAEIDQVKHKVHRDIRRTSDELLKTMAETRNKCVLLTEKFDESLVHVKELGEQLEKIESREHRG